jgi:NitT/TauT family transport system ATP-binding protein
VSIGNVRIQPDSFTIGRERAPSLPATELRVADQSATVVIDRVSIGYATRKQTNLAVSDVSLTLAAGSFVSLIGPSGCGKTSLMNATGGFVEPTAGTITINGAALSGPTPDVAIVFQQYALFPWFTALGNVIYALKRFHLPRTVLRERATEALRGVGLADHADKFPGQLSGGMKQRVAIARALAAAPRVLLMDEPFGALDAQTRLSMHELLLRVWESHRITVMFITHDVDEALLLSDVIHVMSPAPGEILQSFEVPVARPRSIERLDPRVPHIRSQILRSLKSQSNEPL